MSFVCIFQMFYAIKIEKFAAHAFNISYFNFSSIYFNCIRKLSQIKSFICVELYYLNASIKRGTAFFLFRQLVITVNHLQTAKLSSVNKITAETYLFTLENGRNLLFPMDPQKLCKFFTLF